MKSPIIETWENYINEGSRVNEHIIFAGEHQRRETENEESFNEFYGHRHVSNSRRPVKMQIWKLIDFQLSRVLNQ